MTDKEKLKQVEIVTTVDDRQLNEYLMLKKLQGYTQQESILSIN